MHPQKGELSMCDYSLHGIRNRLADEGETLVVHRFYTGSKGLTSPQYIQSIEKPIGFIATLKSMFAGPPDECAVCIPDGARLLLHGISIEFQKTHGLCASEPVTFRQMSAETATYRDAVEFHNGVRVRLQELDEHQMFQVLALASTEAIVESRIS
jgi:hypothetical protein